MKKYHIHVEYNDGSFQWLKNTSEKEVFLKKDIKRITAFCNSNFDVDTKRWKYGRSQFERIFLIS